MTICRLMVSDYMEGTGRFDPDSGLTGLPGDRPLYSNGNLDEGAMYSDWLLKEGYVIEPFLGFDLAGFAYWCCQQLGEI